MDYKELKLPSGKIARIRTQTNRGDDKLAQAALNEGVKIVGTSKGEEQVEISNAAVDRALSIYVERLTESIDGKPVSVEVLDELVTNDYRTLEEAVKEITSNRPKVSKNTTKNS